MLHGNGDVGKLRVHPVHDRVDLLLRHWPEGLVRDRLDALAFVVIADDTFEEHAGAVTRPHHAPAEGRGVKGVVCQIAHPPATGGMKTSSSPSWSASSGDTYDSFTAVSG